MLPPATGLAVPTAAAEGRPCAATYGPVGEPLATDVAFGCSSSLSKHFAMCNPEDQTSKAVMNDCVMFNCAIVPSRVYLKTHI